MYKLRTLSGILAFDAAARHGSLTEAAKELGRTQSAVSQQVKALEAQLGFELFIRRPREVELTIEGKAVAASVREAIESMERAITAQQLRDEPNMLRVTTYQSFAIEWLIPRLPSFNLKHPEIHVHVNADDKRYDLRAEGFDLAIRVGIPPKECELLRGEQFVPIYAPSIKPGQKLSLGDVCDFQQLAHVQANFWPEWLTLNEIPYSGDPEVTFYSHSGMLVQAAAAGGGVALAPLMTAAHAVKQGRIDCIASKPLTTDHAYYLVSARQPESEKVVLFKEWMAEELDRMDADMAPFVKG
jgi:LysR family glycine cleavage system transcriptional activator